MGVCLSASHWENRENLKASLSNGEQTDKSQPQERDGKSPKIIIIKLTGAGWPQKKKILKIKSGHTSAAGKK